MISRILIQSSILSLTFALEQEVSKFVISVTSGTAAEEFLISPRLELSNYTILFGKEIDVH